VTLWQYVEAIAGGELAAAEMATALGLVHDALSDFDGPLPRFDVELADARQLLQPERSPSLTSVDRRFLLGVVDELEATLAAPVGRSLHGSPHAANWLLSGDGPLLLDFETACLGPVE